MKAIRNETSFKKHLMTLLLIITLPLSLLLITNNLYSVNIFNDKIAESNRRTLDFCINQLQRELTTVDQSISGIVAGNPDFITLSSSTGQLQAHLSSLALFDQVKALMPAHPSVGAFFIYSEPSNVERDLFLMDYSYPEKQEIRTFVRSSVADNLITYAMKWRAIEIGGRSYLFRFFGGRSTYVAAMIPLEDLLNPEDWQLEDGAISLFTNSNFKPLTQKKWIDEHQVDLSGDYDRYFITSGQQRFLAIGRPVQNTDCHLVFLVNRAGYFDVLNVTQRSLLLLSFAVVLLIPPLLFWVNRVVVVPLGDITRTMVRIQKGDLDAQISTEGQVREFRQMGEAFNSMMAQVKDLRIASYENEIEMQKAQLRYLQLQIRPHFFLNCLKSIYAFAQQKQFDRLQKMILAFSRHIRYIFKDNLDFVPLGLELDHVRNYMEIQATSAVHPSVCTISAEKSLLSLPIPPLLLQTFVENSVKHGTDPDRALEIEIDVKLLKTEAGDFVNIIVSDNGIGFAPDLLEQINLPAGSVYAEHHVGLNNVKQRLRLIYGDEVQFAFYNSSRGSVSDIIIPIEPSQENGPPEA